MTAANALYADGYPTDDATVRAVYRAARAGALLWTPGRLTTTDASRLDLRPRARATNEQH